jgi:hypothetical protein
VCWSASWDKRHGVWRVAEDAPDPDLYAESRDAETVIGYIAVHAWEPAVRPAAISGPRLTSKSRFC